MKFQALINVNIPIAIKYMYRHAVTETETRQTLISYNLKKVNVILKKNDKSKILHNIPVIRHCY